MEDEGPSILQGALRVARMTATISGVEHEIRSVYLSGFSLTGRVRIRNKAANDAKKARQQGRPLVWGTMTLGRQ